MPDDTPAILRMSEVARYVRLGKTTIYRLLKRGAFPAPLHLTRKSRRWLRSDLDRWLQDLTGPQLSLPLFDEEERP